MSTRGLAVVELELELPEGTVINAAVTSFKDELDRALPEQVCASMRVHTTVRPMQQSCTWAPGVPGLGCKCAMPSGATVLHQGF